MASRKITLPQTAVWSNVAYFGAMLSHKKVRRKQRKIVKRDTTHNYGLVRLNSFLSVRWTENMLDLEWQKTLLQHRDRGLCNFNVEQVPNTTCLAFLVCFLVMVSHTAVHLSFNLPSVTAAVLFQLLLICFTDLKSSHMKCKTKLCF